jgi:TolB-like protein/DNA-binding winged helix-turn-helix (wHTH) protein/Flp pilus assembly protein TadD
MKMENRKKYLLGEFLLDPDSRSLVSDGQPVHLSKLPFQVLLYLIDQRDRVVTRAELLDKFWSGKDVYGDTLRKCVGTIRTALNDRGEQSRFIETRHAEGYRYIGPLREVSQAEASAMSQIKEIPAASFAEQKELEGTEKDQSALVSETVDQSHWTTRLNFIRPYVAAFLFVAVLALAVPTFLAFRKKEQLAIGQPGTLNSIAVLPLKNLSNDTKQEYFSDGVTESLINELARIRDLKVIARNSSFAFQGKEVDVREIGQRLGVAAVLEGSLRRDDETVRISVRLVSTADGRVLWTGDTTRPFKDIITVQDEIGCSVAESLKTILCRDPNYKPGTNDLVAYEAYLKARDLRQKGEPIKAAELYQQAVNTDPNYALAWAGLAEAYAVMEINSLVPPRSAVGKAKECAFKAIALDGSLASPYAALGLLAAFSDRDWAAGERYFGQALATNPNHAVAHAWFANTLLAQGKFAEAEAEYLRARELDPLNARFLNHLAETYYYWRQPDRCLAQAAKALELQPGNEWAYINQAKCYCVQGRYEEAGPAANKTSHQESYRAIILARSGREAEARVHLENYVKTAGETSPYSIASMYAAIGDREAAFAWLQKAADRQQADLVSLKIEPFFDGLRADPRYAALLRRVGLAN